VESVNVETTSEVPHSNADPSVETHNPVPASDASVVPVCDEVLKPADENLHVPSTSSGFVSAAEVSPYPKAPEAGQSRRRRGVTSGSSTVLTESPYKNQLQESLKEKDRNTVKKNTRKVKRSLVQDKADDREVKTNNKGQRNAKAGHNKRARKSKQSTEQDESKCGLCGEQYGDRSGKKTEEDWLQCRQCQVWFHETCAEDSGLVDVDEFVCAKCYR